MKNIRILIGIITLSMILTGCTSAYYQSTGSGAALDDMYGTHDKVAIAKKQQAQAEAQKAAAEARRAEWEARLAESQASTAEDNYYSSTGSNSSYQSVVADDYESAYARRLRGFESGSYNMPSSYYSLQYSDDFRYATAYDPAFYNVMVMGDQVWVEPRYITSMFGSWDARRYITAAGISAGDTLRPTQVGVTLVIRGGIGIGIPAIVHIMIHGGAGVLHGDTIITIPAGATHRGAEAEVVTNVRT